jgi:hypothetical protein
MPMRHSWAVFALLAGCGSPPSDLPVITPEDRAPLQERLRAALSAPHVVGRFYAEYKVGNQVRTSCRGIARAFRSGVVLIEELSESGPELRVLRVGDRAWVYREGWQDATGTPLAGLGTGFQSPYEVLAVLDVAAAKFVAAERGGMACPDMKDLEFFRPLTDRAGVRPPAGARIEGLLKLGFRDGPLITKFTVQSGGSVIWAAKMDIMSWGAAPPMTFDEIPAPFTPEMKAAVRKATEGR